MRLGEILIERKLITQEDLDRALELQKERGMSAVFLNSDGQQLAQELPSQRQLSNERLVTVRSTIASLDLAA